MQSKSSRLIAAPEKIVREQSPEYALASAPRSDAIVIRSPRIDDGSRLWQIAVDSRVLDVNSSYAYLLWCRDFASTSVVAEIDGEVAGFVIGYLRPADPATLFAWQVAVDRAHRGRGIGVAMLDCLLETGSGQAASAIETTVSPDNTASTAMFAALARLRGMGITRRKLFTANHFPDVHEPEELYRIAAGTDHEGRR
ncbi:2,4-diaminobutyric acid acetyltransferase [Nocardia seriolae]|uniref:L-2,4-diaminobutyric acid acetyltransferase n=1 Tax=Nocardia seriolae TaxID=37332 RepID=A0ABC9YY01_9NOCA|nr:diaminobutyrate acetyltransferase [Nocardia seriolae]GAM48359.1 2,4-diaminobutyric acid acetyltransferase [Nocardia seriolae]GAP30297.1 2,4-diaminobutyric acid acetyltransferase [Nocardia seriolae]